MRLTFLGATQTVTGSKYLINSNEKNILVDCGLYQGYKELRQRNWSNLLIEPKKIDAVLLTHAHLDHTGYLPLLVKNGFRGPIYCTSGTKELCSILLPDSGYLQEEEAMLANKYGYSKHKPALPLYTQKEADDTLQYFKTIPFDQSLSLENDIFKVIFKRAGHIIGSSFIRIESEKTSILFSGDLGRPHDLVMQPPSEVVDADYMVVESTYGDRKHEKGLPTQYLGEIITKTVKKGGSVIIPAFAVGRAQSLLYYLYQLKKNNMIPDVPVFLDSPMAINASTILCNHVEELRLSKDDCIGLCAVAKYINTVDDSKKLDEIKHPIIIISASGMVTGGRILHHLKVFGPDPRNTIIFTGYQSGGTRGARIIAGEKEVKIQGQMIPIKAQVKVLSNTSAHADSDEMLLWLEQIKQPPKKVFITHGELRASETLRDNIYNKLGWSAVVPSYLDSADLI